MLYVDFDSDDRSVVDRLLEFGADPKSITAHFHYRQPEVKPESTEERQAWAEMLSRPESAEADAEPQLRLLVSDDTIIGVPMQTATVAITGKVNRRI